MWSKGGKAILRIPWRKVTVSMSSDPKERKVCLGILCESQPVTTCSEWALGFGWLVVCGSDRVTCFRCGFGLGLSIGSGVMFVVILSDGSFLGGL